MACFIVICQHIFMDCVTASYLKENLWEVVPCAELWPVSFILSPSGEAAACCPVRACKVAIPQGDGLKSVPGTLLGAGEVGGSWWPGSISCKSSKLSVPVCIKCSCQPSPVEQKCINSYPVYILKIVLLPLHGRVLSVCLKKLFSTTFVLLCVIVYSKCVCSNILILCVVLHEFNFLVKFLSKYDLKTHFFFTFHANMSSWL